MGGRFESFAWSLIAAAVVGSLLCVVAEWGRVGRQSDRDFAPSVFVGLSQEGAPEARQIPAPGVSPGTDRFRNASPEGAEENALTPPPHGWRTGSPSPTPRQTDGGAWERGGRRVASGNDSAGEESHECAADDAESRSGGWGDLSAEGQETSRGVLASGAHSKPDGLFGGSTPSGDDVLARPEDDAPDTEREFYVSFLVLHRADARVLDALWPTVLDGPGPDCRKVALLRALHDTGSAEATDAFRHAMTALPEEAPRGVASVPQFALDFLCTRAARSATTRSALEQAIWPMNGGALIPARRAQAATALLSGASKEDLGRLTSSILSERDPKVIAGLRAGLRANDSDPAWARALLDRLPVDEESVGEEEGPPPE